MSLADRIINAKSSALSYNADELGIPNDIKSPEYFCARALKLNPSLHTEDRVLYNGHTKVTPTRAEIAVLTKSLDITGNMAALVHARLIELAPKLDESCIAITPHLLWHKDTGELEETEDEIPVDSPWN